MRAAALEWEAQIASLPGGRELLERQKAERQARTGKSQLHPVAYWAGPDPVRDAGAQALLEHKQIGVPDFVEDKLALHFTCYSSLATPHDKNPVTYEIWLGLRGNASCTCPDFQECGGACKHMRAALEVTEKLRTAAKFPIAITLPQSEDDAHRIEAQVLLETGAIPPAIEAVQADLAVEDSKERRCAMNAVGDALEHVTADGDTTGPTGVDESGPADDSMGDTDGDGASDSESVATDAESSPDTLFHFTLLKTGSKASIHDQSTSRALHELKTAAPKLGLLAQLLSTARLSNAKDISTAASVKSHIDTLSTELGRLLAEAPDLEPEATSAATVRSSSPPRRASTPPLNHRNHRAKRQRTDILNASPEKAQKRKQSYSIH